MKKKTKNQVQRNTKYSILFFVLCFKSIPLYIGAGGKG